MIPYVAHGARQTLFGVRYSDAREMANGNRVTSRYYGLTRYSVD